MAHPDRLSGLDASFLALEAGGAHMHVGSVLVFDGPAPPYVELIAHLERRLHLVPRYRQKLASVPLGQGRPLWVDDPHFNIRYHVRHTGLPEPMGEEELRQLAGHVFSQALDRSKPLWEIWLVDRVDGAAAGLGHGPCHAIVNKTHHALVDGISGVDITTVLFDLEPDPPPPPAPERAWLPRPEPSSATLLADALAERAHGPVEAARTAAGAMTRPRESARQAGRLLGGLSAIAAAGMGGAPTSPYNVAIGPHRRFAWARGELATFKAVKNALGGTVNDVVLTAVTGALRTHLLAHGHAVAELSLKAMVPVSVRAEAERGALGNRVTTMYAPLPVSEPDPAARFRIVRESMAGLKESGQAVGAEALTALTGFAPPTVIAQAARLQGRQRFFNLTVTNVPGPQFPLYLLGAQLEAMYPQVALAANTALGIAVMSYDGRLDFGLIGDFDALPDVEALAGALLDAIAELADLAGAPAPDGTRNGAAEPARARKRVVR